MRSHPMASMRRLALVIAVVALVADVFGEGGQTPPTAAANTTTAKAPAPPRTTWGDPDLQGVWNFSTITPLERPTELAGKEVLTAEEAAEFEKETNVRRNQDRRDGAGTDADVARAYNHFWWDFGTKVVGTRRTSLVVDPPDGRIPPLTPDGQRRAEARALARQRPAAGPEDRSLWERCIMGNNAGPPIVPGVYNNNVQLFQTPEYVVILNEMIHDARIVPLDGRPHLPSNIPQWLGDSRGRWENRTLVIDTTNFPPDTNFRGATAKLHVLERFTRVDPETLLYEFMVEDPATWTRPWSATFPMTRTADRIYEYACHEGNHGIVGILSGARAQEKAAEDAAKKSSR